MADLTTTVPNEILWACMDFISLVDIVHLMHLSKRWQRLAINHETYWKYLTITSPSTSATEWFLLRLSRSKLRLISIDARINDAEDCYVCIILRAITAHLSHLQSLNCCVRYRHSGWLFDALEYPAYNLERLTLRVAVDMEDLNIALLPRTLMMRTAPRLARLSVQNISLERMPVGAFPSIKHLDFGYTVKYEFIDVQVLLEALVSVRHLTLTGYPRVKDPDAINPSVFRRLDFLSLYLGCSLPENMRELLQMHSLPHVVCARADPFEVSSLMNSLDGKLDMHIHPEEDADDVFFIHILESATSRVRSFAESTQCYGASRDDGMACDVLLRTDITARVVFLSLTTTLWTTIVPFVQSLPALTELRLVVALDDNAFLETLSIPKLHCPNLRRLTMRSGDSPAPTTVKAEALTSFILRALSSESFPIAVALDGARLSSAAELPPDLIRSMEQGHRSTQIKDFCFREPSFVQYIL